MDYNSPDWVPTENECHFSWKLDKMKQDKTSNSDLIVFFRQKLGTDAEEVSSVALSTHWRRFLIKSTLAFELARTKQTENVREGMDHIEQCLELLESKEDFYIMKYKKALQYIALSLKQNVLAIMNEPSEVEKVTSQMREIKLDDDPSRAAILGFRAEIYSFYGSNAAPEAVNIVKRAIKFYHDEPEWHLCLGILLNRIRHYNKFTDKGPTDEEIRVLTLAYENSEELGTKSASALYLASAYSDKGWAFKKRGNMSESSNCFSVQKQYHKEAFELNPKDLTTMAKCAKGMLWGPKNMRRPKEAYDMASKVLAKDPEHIMANETASLLCEADGKLQDALKHSRVAANQGSFGSFFSCLRLMMKMKQSFSVQIFFDEMLEKFRSENYVHQIHLNAIIFYLLFTKDQVVASSRHLNLLFNCDSPLLKQMKDKQLEFTVWFQPSYKVDVFKMIHNEIMIVLGDSNRSRQREDRMFLEEMKGKIENMCPGLIGTKSDDKLIEKMVRMFGLFETKQCFSIRNSLR